MIDSTMYRRGRQFEYRVLNHLKKHGYLCLRSPRSGGPFDLVALKPGIVLLVQCKIGGQCPPGEWNALFDVAESVAAIPVLASRMGCRDMVYERMTGRKDGSKRRQPKEPISLDDLAGP